MGILGAGNWGTALSLLAAKNNKTVYLYDRDTARAAEMQTIRENKKYLRGIHIPENVIVTSDLKKVFETCILILPTVPARAFRDLAHQCAPYARGDHILVHGTKGFEPGSRKRMTEILAEETPCLRTGVLSGPNIAAEHARGLPGATVVASRFEEVVTEAQSALTSELFKVYGSYEPTAVEWAGALKNILALGAGIINELGYGQNTLAVFVARGLAEMSRLIGATGTHSKSLFGLAGIGDIFVTCTSPLSRNFRAGQMLARGKAPDEIQREVVMVVEGFNTLQVAIELAAEHKVDLPLVTGLWQIAYGRKNVLDVLRALMERPATYERIES